MHVRKRAHVVSYGYSNVDQCGQLFNFYAGNKLQFSALFPPSAPLMGANHRVVGKNGDRTESRVF
eukprot:337364-Amorphochlora_amoeboformis.AAC.1